MAQPTDINSSYSNNSFRAPILVTESGKEVEAPKNIITNLSALRSLYQIIRQASLSRIELWAAIEGLTSGNPPYDPDELARAGLAHIANYNSLDARSAIEKYALGLWNLLNQTEIPVQISLRNFSTAGDALGEDIMLKQWADIMSEEFDDIFLKGWYGFKLHINTLIWQLSKIGLSPIIWSDELDWRWRTVEMSRYLLPDMTSTDTSLWTQVGILTPFTVQELYEIYDKIKDKPSDSVPWDKDELAALLLFRANTFAKSNNHSPFLNPMDLQVRMQENSAAFTTLFTDTIYLVSFLQKEYDGKFSHYMMDPTFSEGQNFLFFADRQYTDLNQFSILFTASPGEFTVYSNRGVGHKIFSSSQAMQMLECSMVDLGRWSGTPLISSNNPVGTPVDQIRFYPGVPTNIGTAQLQKNDLGENIDQIINLSQYLTQKQQFNAANSGDDPGIPDAKQGSLSEPQSRRKSYREGGILKFNVQHFYCTLDALYQEMLSKILKSKKGYPGYKEVQVWKKRCMDRGVPEEAFAFPDSSDPYYQKLPKHISIRASRAAGDGSTSGLIMGLESMAPVLSDFGAREAFEYRRLWIKAALGKEYVPIFMPERTPDEISGGASLAGLENIAMKGGESPVFSPDNEHRAHIATHLALANSVIEQVSQQQMSPVDADKVFTVLVPHMGEHIQVLAKSIFAKKFLEGILPAFNQIQQYATLNRKNATAMIQAQIKQQQEAQAEQQRVLSEEELKNLKAQGDEQRSNFKVGAQVQRADRANETRAQIMREKVVKDSDNQRLKIQLEADNKKQKNSLENNLETLPLPELRSQLSGINGATPAPNDIEGVPPV